MENLKLPSAATPQGVSHGSCRRELGETGLLQRQDKKQKSRTSEAGQQVSSSSLARSYLPTHEPIYQARIRQKWQKIRHIAKIAKYSATALFHHDNEKKSPPVASTRSRCSSLQQQYTLITPRFFRIPLLIYFSDHRAKKAERFGR